MKKETPVWVKIVLSIILFLAVALMGTTLLWRSGYIPTFTLCACESCPIDAMCDCGCPVFLGKTYYSGDHTPWFIENLLTIELVSTGIILPGISVFLLNKLAFQKKK